jgi:hypothetical protein
LNLSASFSISDAVYLRFSGGRSGSHRIPPRTSTVEVPAVETPPCTVSKEIALPAQINSVVQQIFNLLSFRQVFATMRYDQVDDLLRTTFLCRPLILASFAKSLLLRVDGV